MVPEDKIRKPDLYKENDKNSSSFERDQERCIVGHCTSAS
jgi:hypothetical protein